MLGFIVIIGLPFIVLYGIWYILKKLYDISCLPNCCESRESRQPFCCLLGLALMDETPCLNSN